MTVPPTTSSTEPLSPQVHILEFNASPDFHQSGERLQSKIREMFDGVVQGFVKPFFKIKQEGDEDEWDGEWAKGDERGGWKCFRKGEVRRGW